MYAHCLIFVDLRGYRARAKIMIGFDVFLKMSLFTQNASFFLSEINKTHKFLMILPHSCTRTIAQAYVAFSRIFSSGKIKEFVGRPLFSKYNGDDVDERCCDPTILRSIFLSAYDNKRLCSWLLTFTLHFEFCYRWLMYLLSKKS